MLNKSISNSGFADKSKFKISLYLQDIIFKKLTSRTFTCDLILTVFYWNSLKGDCYQGHQIKYRGKIENETQSFC